MYLRDHDWWEYEAPSNSGVWRILCKIKSVLIGAYTSNLWLNDTQEYSVKEGYKWLQGNYETVPWHYWVWNSTNIPKNSFVSWLAVLDKLRTRTSLARARLCNNTECLLCDSGEDSCQHLFFQCTYSDKVRRFILVWLGLGITQQDRLSTAWRK